MNDPMHAQSADLRPVQATRGLWGKGAIGFTWLMILLFTWMMARFALRNSFFIADDFDHFQLATSLPFMEYLLTPIDVHFVPLHRLASALLLALAPLDFRLGLWAMVAIQLASSVMLALLLKRLRPGPWNPVLVVFFACNSTLLPLLIWWSAGIHRLPYILLTITCLYCYLGYRDSRRLRDLVGCCICFVTALGFYSKAVLIPFYILALEFCLSWRDGYGAIGRYKLGIVLLLLAVAYVGWYVMFAPVLRGSGEASIAVAIQITLTFFRVLGGLLLLHAAAGWGVSGALVALFWVSLIVFTCLRRRENLVFWTALISVLALNFLIIAASSRAQMFGVFLAFVPRYFLEVIYLITIFLCLILNPAAPAAVNNRRGGMGAGVLLVLFGVFYPVMAYQSAKASFARVEAPLHKQTQRFMSTLLSDLDKMPAAQTIKIAEGSFPLYVYGQLMQVHKPFADVLPLRYPNLQFVTREQAQFEIDSQGRVLPVTH